MERDKRGRFIKKGEGGLSIDTNKPINIEIDGIKYKIKDGAYQEYDNFKKLHNLNDYSFQDYLKNFGNNYLEYVPLDIKNLPELSKNLPKSPENFALNTPLYTPEYNLNKKGQIVDQFGKSYIDSIDSKKSPFNFKFNMSQNSSNNKEGSPAGRTTWDKKSFGEFLGDTFSKPIDKEKLANFLDFTKVGIGTSVNNKITDRTLEAEKPFLQDVSESHRSIYGDYRSQIEGEKAAAQLRNIASQPITSDGALQQDMMLKAQLEGQNFINQGLAQDDVIRRQTQEVAWQQEKENQQQRQSAAMQNRQAMLETQKNKANLENIRDSGNYSQIIEPFISTQEQRLRNEAIRKEQLEQQYKDASVVQDVWTNYDFGNDPNADKYNQIRTDYINGGAAAIQENIANNLYTQADYNAITRLINNEILRKKAEIQGISLNNPVSISQYGIWSKKRGGILHKATLTKRVRDNDRGSKSIESSKKIAAKFLEKAINSLYTYKDIELIAKINKRKYQAGGGLPLVGYTPVFATNEATIGPRQTKAETETKGEDLTTKDLLDLLKTSDILRSDFIVIQELLSNFMITDNMDPLGIDSSNIASRYIQILGKIKDAKANKEWFDKAYEKLRDNNALNEYVITSTGQFIGVNEEGDYDYFSIDEIEQGELKGYQLLTNSNLLNIRANDPNVAFNSEIISEIANGIGIESVTNYINNTIQNLGSEKTQTQVFGDQSKEVLAGLQQLQKAAQEVGQDLSISQLYEANILNERQTNQAMYALSYLWQTLPSNMKSLLYSKVGSKEGAFNLINNLVNSKLSSNNKLEFSPKNSNSKSKSKTGTGTGIDGLELSPALMLQRGYGERETIVIQNNTSTGLKIDAVKLPVTKIGNETIGSVTLEDISRSQYGGILDFNNASMGEELIPFEGRSNVAVDGSKIYSMYLPIDQNEFYATGKIIPDLDLVDKLNEVNQTIKEKQITDISEINSIYEQSGLPTYMNDDGSVVSTSYRRFGVLNGTAINRAFGVNSKILKDNEFLKEVDDENIINGAIDIMNQNRNSKNKIEFDGGWFGDDIMYQGTIFIPISNDVFSGIAGSGKTITSEEAEDLYEKQQQQQRVNATYINPGELQ